MKSKGRHLSLVKPSESTKQIVMYTESAAPSKADSKTNSNTKARTNSQAKSKTKSKNTSTGSYEQQIETIYYELQDMGATLVFTCAIAATMPANLISKSDMKSLQREISDALQLLDGYEEVLGQMPPDQLSRSALKKLKDTHHDIVRARALLVDMDATLAGRCSSDNNQVVLLGGRKKARLPKVQLDQSFQLKVTLKESSPPIWRRLIVPGDFDLGMFSQFIQETMGWLGYHLHQFIIDGEYYGESSDEGFTTTLDERKYTLNSLGLREGQTFRYEYDFGDDWDHVIKVEKVIGELLEADCIKGKRACPPEDCGGIYGYERLVAAWRDPKCPDRAEVIDIVGEDFDPDKFEW